jgi:HAD superfamily hydrolase (TIGR01450 family)
MELASTPARLSGLSKIAPSYRAILCDVWGVIHNGLEPIRSAVEALTAARRSGRIVMLITNAPRPLGSVVEQLQEIGVDLECFDDLVSSGDVARSALSERGGARIFHLGPPRDLPIYEGLPIELTELASADIVSCTGLFDDETETAEDYDPIFQDMLTRRLRMICSNPDLVVERGDRVIPCAGALAQRYRALGGEAVVIGKPHPPIYTEAIARIARMAGVSVPPADILAIGDGAGTDIVGANRAGMDALFVASGINTNAEGGQHIADVLASHNAEARYFMPRLAW